MVIFSEEEVFTFGVPVYRNKQIVGAMIASSVVDVFSEIIDGEKVLKWECLYPFIGCEWEIFDSFLTCSC